ncbi:MAG: SMC-Scp complex subunit ScpB [Nanoarchaeota archaeon]|jgi:segregation and condensation protein B|nr:SMC-Scp complex subunit ScpB [Nanoarchaeota archaeon]|tara:strand:+ start:4043 stop:4588 length:546 start_codon:yes stop_codon:yes gene_type:complete
MTEDYKKKIEAVLFASGKYLEIEKIAEMLNLGSTGIVIKTLEELKKDYSQKDSAIEILQEGNKYRMNIKSNFVPIVKNLMTDTEIDRPVISTLAIIAWKQPILQSKVVKMRGNTAYEHLKLLEEKELISRQRYKLTKILKLTPKFYEYFDTNKDTLTSKLPKDELEENTADSIKKMFGESS